MRSSASGGSKRGAGWVVPTPRQSHWPTTSPRSAHWPLRAQCQPTGIFIWKSLHRRGECPQSRSSGPDSGGTLTVPPSCSIAQGRLPLHTPWPFPLPHQGAHPCPQGPAAPQHPLSTLLGPHQESSASYPTWGAPGRQARPGVPCVRHLVAGQVNGAMALAGSLMSLKNLGAPSKNAYKF